MIAVFSKIQTKLTKYNYTVGAEQSVLDGQPFGTYTMNTTRLSWVEE